MKFEDIEMRPEAIIFELIQASGRAENKIDTILQNQGVFNKRMDKREAEYEALRERVEVTKAELSNKISAEHEALRKSVEAINIDLRSKIEKVGNRTTILETAQGNNWKWLIAIGTISGGIAALVGIFV